LRPPITDYFRAGLIPLDIIHLESYLPSEKKKTRRENFLDFAKKELGKKYNQFDRSRFEEQYDILVADLKLDEPWSDSRDDRYELNGVQRKLHQLFSSGVHGLDHPVPFRNPSRLVRLPTWKVIQNGFRS